MSLFAAGFAAGEYRLGHHLPRLTYSLAMKFWLAAQVGLMVAAVAVVFVIPSMLLASRNRPVFATLIAATPYVLAARFFWVISTPPSRLH